MKHLDNQHKTSCTYLMGREFCKSRKYQMFSYVMAVLRGYTSPMPLCVYTSSVDGQYQMSDWPGYARFDTTSTASR